MGLIDVIPDKKALRKACGQIAAAMTAEERQAASQRITQFVLSACAYGQANTVFLYVSTDREPDTAELIRQAIRDGKRVCVPRCREKPWMDAAELKDPALLVPGAYGIREPKGGIIVPPEEIDLAIIPCVAADGNGMRLGHGAGFYDAFLSGTGMQKWCLCFEKLLLDSLPAAPWDVAMDAVVTEAGICFRRTEGGV